MPRLLRPHIPLDVRCRVAMRQLGEMWPEQVIKENRADPAVAPQFRRSLGRLLASRLARLAELLDCAPADLRLDHDPPLGARRKIFRNEVHIGYLPAPNDAEHLIYREKRAHHIKTNVRGDGAQHPDRVLIKRARRAEKSSAQKSCGKRKKHRWTKRSLKSPNRWPPRGSRKIGRRP